MPVGLETSVAATADSLLVKDMLPVSEGPADPQAHWTASPNPGCCGRLGVNQQMEGIFLSHCAFQVSKSLKKEKECSGCIGSLAVG